MEFTVWKGWSCNRQVKTFAIINCRELVKERIKGFSQKLRLYLV